MRDGSPTASDVIAEDQLVQRIRAKLTSGELSRAPSLRTWAGHGTDQRCAVCGGPIPALDIEIETAAGRFYHFRCYRLLCAERNRPDR